MIKHINIITKEEHNFATVQGGVWKPVENSENDDKTVSKPKAKAEPKAKPATKKTTRASKDAQEILDLL